MTLEHVLLRTFADDDLIFDANETKAILKFFFQAVGHQIDAASIGNELRALAQGLLVEAVDATYAMGWIEATFRWVANPGAGVKQALKKLALRAARHWFKHLKDQSLLDARIYERVRDQLARSFRSPFQIILQAKGRSTHPWIAVVDYGVPATRGEHVWG